MNLIRSKTTSRVLLGASFCMLLMAGYCDPPKQVGTQTGTVTETEQASPPSVVTGSFINVHANWPLADETVDVSIADDPYQLNYMLVIDTSGSMGETCSGEDKIVTARQAAIDFISNIPQAAAIGLVEFGGDVRTVVPLGTDQHAAVQAAIEALRPGGGTPMAGGIYSGYQELLRSGSAQLGYGDYEMVILGDGAPGNRTQTTNNIDYLVRQTRVGVTTIGFCAGLAEVLDREGVAYFEVATPEELARAFDSVLVEADSFEDIDF